MSKVCSECNRPVATSQDEGDHNTGECGCPTARSLCWRRWSGNKCLEYSIYDPVHGEGMLIQLRILNNELM